MQNEARSERQHALDQIRALAMLAGVVFHASLAHSTLMQPFWPGALGTTSPIVDALAWLSHLIRMPLFFLVSGYFTAQVLERRGIGGLLRQRMRRLLLPFLVAWPVLTLTLVVGLQWAAANVDSPNAVLGFLKNAANNETTSAPLTLGHLWFLPYLLLLSVLVWACRTLNLGWILDAVMSRKPTTVILCMPLLLVLPFAATSAPHPAPESLFPQLWAVGLYGPFFALGFALLGRLRWLESLPVGWLSTSVLILYCIFFWLLMISPSEDLWPRAALHMAALQAAVAAWGTVLFFVVGLKVLGRPNRVLSYIARSAYTVYLVHLPLVLALQIALLGSNVPGPFAFAIVVCGALVGSLLVYELLVRRTFLRQWIG